MHGRLQLGGEYTTRFICCGTQRRLSGSRARARIHVFVRGWTDWSRPASHAPVQDLEMASQKQNAPGHSWHGSLGACSPLPRAREKVWWAVRGRNQILDLVPGIGKHHSVQSGTSLLLGENPEWRSAG